jgi:hypothetical protein
MLKYPAQEHEGEQQTRKLAHAASAFNMLEYFRGHAVTASVCAITIVWLATVLLKACRIRKQFHALV